MSRNVGLKGQIRAYVLWPLFFSILLIIFNIFVYFIDRRAGFATTVFAVVYIGVALFLYLKNRSLILNEMVSFATKYGQVQRQLLRELEIPYALLDDTGKIVWTNETFEHTMKVKRNTRKSISSVIPAITKNHLPGISRTYKHNVRYSAPIFLSLPRFKFRTRIITFFFL